MIKVDLIEYLKARRDKLEQDIELLKLPERECVRKTSTLRKLGALSEIMSLIRTIEKSAHD